MAHRRWVFIGLTLDIIYKSLLLLSKFNLVDKFVIQDHGHGASQGFKQRKINTVKRLGPVKSPRQ
jgi:hypothetical protein